MNNKQIIIIGGIIVGAFALLVFIFVFWKLWKNNQANGTSISSTSTNPRRSTTSISSTPRWSKDTERTISALTDTNEYTKYPNPDNKGGKYRRTKRKKRYLKN
jgi:heme/copper-type cytochrome/quinol oxidase subunit 1